MIGPSRTLRFAHAAAAALACLAGAPARADYLIVSRDQTIVRDGPAGSFAEIARIAKDGVLPLAAPSLTNRWYSVTLPDGSPGWVYHSFARRYAGAPPGAPSGAGGLAAPSGSLEVHVINVGQGDAVLIRCPDGAHEMLIDAGDSNARYPASATKFRAYLDRVQPKTNAIEVVLASHPHADHLGSVAWTLRERPVGLYVDNGAGATTVVYRDVDDAWSESGSDYWSGLDDAVPNVDFCPRPDVSAVILRPAGFGSLADPNDNSLIVRVDFADDSFLFVGDAEKEQEEQLLHDASIRPRLDCDFLKVGHHGSDTSSTTAFLDAVSPDVAAISCGVRDVGTNAGYRHPRLSTIVNLLPRVRSEPGRDRRIDAYDKAGERWTAVNIDRALYITAADGDLVFLSDGRGIRLRASP